MKIGNRISFDWGFTVPTSADDIWGDGCDLVGRVYGLLEYTGTVRTNKLVNKYQHYFLPGLAWCAPNDLKKYSLTVGVPLALERLESGAVCCLPSDASAPQAAWNAVAMFDKTRRSILRELGPPKWASWMLRKPYLIHTTEKPHNLKVSPLAARLEF